MRYIGKDVLVLYFFNQVDELVKPGFEQPRFSTMPTSVIPEVGEKISGFFGWHGAEVAAWVDSVDKINEIRYHVKLTQVADDRCTYCRAVNGHELVQNRYLCPAADAAALA